MICCRRASQTGKRRGSAGDVRERVRKKLVDMSELVTGAAIARLIAEHEQGRQDHRKKLYTLLAYQLWARRYRPA